MRHTLFFPAIAGLAVASGAFGADVATTDSDDVRALVAEMIADAESRSSLLQSGGTAGHDGHFFLSSPDGNFHMELSGQIQFRYYLNFRDDDGGDDDFVPGFQTRRTKLSFDGHVFDPDLFYHVTGAFSRAGGNFQLEDAFVGMKLDDGWKVRWGQFKEGFMREELVSSKRQLMVDRSVVNEVFNQGRSQGVEFAYSADEWRFTASFSDGFNSANTDLGASPADYSLTGRAEWLLAGDWGQFKDFTSPRGSEEGIMLGGALHWEQGPDLNAGGDEQQIISYTVDLSWESDGWNAFAAFVGSNIEDQGGVSGADADLYGWVVQGGVYVSDDWELVARISQIMNDDDLGDDFSEWVIGANYYIHGHAAKFSVDLAYFPMDSTVDTGGTVGQNTGIGLLSSTEDDQYAIRAQFQLLF